MKKLFLSIAVLCALLIPLCSCQSTNDATPSGESESISASEKELGTITNPYSINDEIEFSLLSEVKAEGTLKVKISEMVWHDDIVFTGYSEGESRWMLTFLFEILESDYEEPIRPWLTCIDFGNINDGGIAGDYDGLPRDYREIEELSDVSDYYDLEVLPGFKVASGCALRNLSGGDLKLITLKFNDLDDNNKTIYIDPTK